MRSFKEQVEAAQELSPTFVNSHSCKDFLTREDSQLGGDLVVKITPEVVRTNCLTSFYLIL